LNTRLPLVCAVPPPDSRCHAATPRLDAARRWTGIRSRARPQARALYVAIVPCCTSCADARPSPRALTGRPAEFFTRFTPPKTTTKWTSRLKCNGTCCEQRHSLRAARLVWRTRALASRTHFHPFPRSVFCVLSRAAAYYYRVNYFLIVVLLFVVAFVRYPLAFVAAAGAVFTTLCLNDSFSHTIRRAKVLTPGAHTSARCADAASVLLRAASASCARRAGCTRRWRPSCATRRPRACPALSAVSAHSPHTRLTPRARPRRSAPAGRPYTRSRTVYMCGQDRRLVVGAMYLFFGAARRSAARRFDAGGATQARAPAAR
jgi:hypothetical protein